MKDSKRNKKIDIIDVAVKVLLLVICLFVAYCAHAENLVNKFEGGGGRGASESIVGPVKFEWADSPRTEIATNPVQESCEVSSIEVLG